MTSVTEKSLMDIAVATARMIGERRIDDEEVPIRVPSLGPESA